MAQQKSDGRSSLLGGACFLGFIAVALLWTLAQSGTILSMRQ